MWLICGPRSRRKPTGDERISGVILESSHSQLNPSLHTFYHKNVDNVCEADIAKTQWSERSPPPQLQQEPSLKEGWLLQGGTLPPIASFIHYSYINSTCNAEQKRGWVRRGRVCGKRAGNHRDAQLIFLVSWAPKLPQSQALKEGLIVIMTSHCAGTLLLFFASLIFLCLPVYITYSPPHHVFISVFSLDPDFHLSSLLSLFLSLFPSLLPFFSNFNCIP